jgi:uncharacterized protein YegL
MSEEFNARVNPDNPTPRIACVLLLDTSGSMFGEPIDHLNEGLKKFSEYILEDPVARKSAELLVISFGGQVYEDPNFVEAQHFKPPTLVASGSTPIAQAIVKALDALTQQKALYRREGIEYFRPWLIVMSDGAPTDAQTEVDAAVAALDEAQRRKGVTVFPIGIGPQADMAFLSRLGAEAKPAKRDALHLTNFDGFFQWLKESLTAVSNSGQHGSSDTAIAQTESLGQNPLPSPAGWATW